MPGEPDRVIDSHFTLTVRIPKPSRQWLRISLRSFLIVVFLSAVILGLWGRRVRERVEQKKYSARVYYVAPLVLKPDGAKANYGDLLAEIKAIEPETWGDSRGTIQIFPTNLSIVVSQKEEVHETIEHLIAEKRKNLNQLPTQ